MNIKDYINNRLEDQISWYDKKSQAAQRKYKNFQTAEIFFAALIPILSLLVDYCRHFTIIIAILGAAITVIESLSRLNKYHEHWLEYRSTCELLRYHKNLFETQSYPYNEKDETIDNLLVKNVENIISSENNQWKTINSTQEESNQKN